jgi:lipopolysaccharide transport system ATP-binding protein
MQISVERVSKLYRLDLGEDRAQDLTVRLVGALSAPMRNLRRLRSLDTFADTDHTSVVWALRDVTFGVEPGDVVGIIGRNGAGKSTLLKILSRITRPTRGRLEMVGRVSSLLEVGTGFHPELSGRENIFLNGAIIGMRKAEIRRKLDAIVDFAGVERFLDTPIKRYSSGMKVRLAFAVAAHLEPDILVIDEVLAVGDTEFQQKCIGAMAAFGRSGRTVLFVSHNLAAVQSLCRRGIVLEKGNLEYDGTVDGAIEKYLRGIGEDAQAAAREDGLESDGFVLKTLAARCDGAGYDGLVRAGSPCAFDLSIAGRTRLPAVIVNVWISGGFGERLLLLSSRLAGVSLRGFEERLTCEIRVPRLMLMPGHYQLNAALFSSNGERIATWEQIESVEVYPDPDAPALTLPSVADRGVVYAPAAWDVCTDGDR